jgi:hypothetical protein
MKFFAYRYPVFPSHSGEKLLILHSIVFALLSKSSFLFCMSLLLEISVSLLWVFILCQYCTFLVFIVVLWKCWNQAELSNLFFFLNNVYYLYKVRGFIVIFSNMQITYLIILSVLIALLFPVIINQLDNFSQKFIAILVSLKLSFKLWNLCQICRESIILVRIQKILDNGKMQWILNVHWSEILNFPLLIQ